MADWMWILLGGFLALCFLVWIEVDWAVEENEREAPHKCCTELDDPPRIPPKETR